MVKVYTRGGDKGLTSLTDGSRVSKADPRLDCYGSVDELNSTLGLIATLAQADHVLEESERNKLCLWIAGIQNDLFRLGSDLATPPEKGWDGQKIITIDDVKAQEKLIDQCDKEIPQLTHFVLPGGTLINAELHRARTICRRTERLVAGFQEQLQLNPKALTYLNRLSDLLFTLARWHVHKSHVQEQVWQPDKGLAAIIAESK